VTNTTGTQGARVANPEFEHYQLNERGIAHSIELITSFDTLLNILKNIIPEGRELSLVRTNLEQACFWAKKGMSKATDNHDSH